MDETQVQQVMGFVKSAVDMAREGFRQDMIEELRPIRQEIQQIRTDLKQTQTDVKQIQTDLKQTQTDVKQIQTDLKQTQTDVKQIQVDLQTFKSDVSSEFFSLKRRMVHGFEELKAEIKRVRDTDHQDTMAVFGDMAKLRKRVNRLRVTAGNHEGRIAALEEARR